MNGVDYWRARLRPHAEGGYTRGLLDDYEVTLYGPDGAEVHLERPGSNGWHRPSDRDLGGEALDALLDLEDAHLQLLAKIVAEPPGKAERERERQLERVPPRRRIEL